MNVAADESIDIEIKSDGNELSKVHVFNIDLSDNEFSLLDADLKEIQTAYYGQEMLFNGLRISIKSWAFFMCWLLQDVIYVKKLGNVCYCC